MKPFSSCAQVGRCLGKAEICCSMSGDLAVHILVPGIMESSAGPEIGVHVLC